MIGNTLMDQARLQAILAIARAGSPNAAAREAGLAPTTYYRQVQAMEDAVGSALFVRNRGSWSATPLGTKLIEIATGLEEQLRDFRLAASSHEGGGGILRVTTSDAFANFYLAGKLAGFATVAPHITVDLITTNRRLDLSKGEADVAVRPHSQPGDMLIGQKAGRMTHGLYVSSSHARQGDILNAATSLKNHRVLAYGAAINHFDASKWIANALQGQKPVAYFNTMTAMAKAAEHGLGLVVLPDYVGRTFQKLKRVCPAGNGLPADIWLLRHTSQRRNTKATAFLRYFNLQIKQDAEIFNMG